MAILIVFIGSFGKHIILIDSEKGTILLLNRFRLLMHRPTERSTAKDGCWRQRGMNVLMMGTFVALDQLTSELKPTDPCVRIRHWCNRWWLRMSCSR